jgi:hypothetical protein
VRRLPDPDTFEGTNLVIEIDDRQLRDPQGLEALVRQTYSQRCSH